MTPAEDWRRAMHHREPSALHWTVRGLVIIAAELSVGLILLDLGVFGAGCVAGGLGLLGAGLLWWEV